MSYRKDGLPRKHWTLSEETKKKLSAIKKGVKFTDAHCKHLSESLKGRVASNKGKPMSEETKKKMSESQRRRFRGST